MRLESEEMVLFEAACGDLHNTHAQELLNVFGVETPHEVLESLSTVPPPLMTELVGYVWKAIDDARRADRTGSRFVVRSAHP